MAELIKTHVSYSDMQSILTDVKAFILAKFEAAGGDITEVAAKVNTLVGSDVNKSVRSISAEEVAKIVAEAPESFDTLKEIAEWISTHSATALEMQNAITANTNAIGVKAKDEDPSTGLYKEIEDAVSAEASRADAAEKVNAGAIAAEKTRAEAAEGALSDRLDVIEGEEAGSIKKALQDAKDYADGLDSAMDSRMDAVEAAVGTTSVADQIKAAIEGLDSSKEVTDNGVKVSVKLVDGKLDETDGVKVDASVLASRVSANEDAIDAINDEETGILAQANEYADSLADNYDEAGAADAVKTELEAKYGDWATAEQVKVLRDLFALPSDEESGENE